MAQRSALQSGDIDGFELDVACRWAFECDHQAANRCLPTARLADEAERLALLDGERHVGHGLDGADLSLHDRG